MLVNEKVPLVWTDIGREAVVEAEAEEAEGVEVVEVGAVVARWVGAGRGGLWVSRKPSSSPSSSPSMAL